MGTVVGLAGLLLRREAFVDALTRGATRAGRVARGSRARERTLTVVVGAALVAAAVAVLVQE